MSDPVYWLSWSPPPLGAEALDDLGGLEGLMPLKRKHEMEDDGMDDGGEVLESSMGGAQSVDVGGSAFDVNMAWASGGLGVQEDTHAGHVNRSHGHGRSATGTGSMIAASSSSSSSEASVAPQAINRSNGEKNWWKSHAVQSGREEGLKRTVYTGVKERNNLGTGHWRQLDLLLRRAAGHAESPLVQEGSSLSVPLKDLAPTAELRRLVDSGAVDPSTTANTGRTEFAALEALFTESPVGPSRGVALAARVQVRMDMSGVRGGTKDDVHKSLLGDVREGRLVQLPAGGGAGGTNSSEITYALVPTASPVAAVVLELLVCRRGADGARLRHVTITTWAYQVLTAVWRAAEERIRGPPTSPSSDDTAMHLFNVAPTANVPFFSLSSSASSSTHATTQPPPFHPRVSDLRAPAMVVVQGKGEDAGVYLRCACGECDRHHALMYRRLEDRVVPSDNGQYLSSWKGFEKRRRERVGPKLGVMVLETVDGLIQSYSGGLGGLLVRPARRVHIRFTGDGNTMQAQFGPDVGPLTSALHQLQRTGQYQYRSGTPTPADTGNNSACEGGITLHTMPRNTPWLRTLLEARPWVAADVVCMLLAAANRTVGPTGEIPLTVLTAELHAQLDHRALDALEYFAAGRAPCRTSPRSSGSSPDGHPMELLLDDVVTFINCFGPSFKHTLPKDPCSPIDDPFTANPPPTRPLFEDASRLLDAIVGEESGCERLCFLSIPEARAAAPSVAKLVSFRIATSRRSCLVLSLPHEEHLTVDGARAYVKMVYVKWRAGPMGVLFSLQDRELHEAVFGSAEVYEGGRLGPLGAAIANAVAARHPPVIHLLAAPEKGKYRVAPS